jgi:cardiolipin synthase
MAGNRGEMLGRMLAAIAEARQSIRLEMYIVHDGATAEQFREALLQASRRGVRVQVLVDAVGSMVLPESFWAPLRGAGGEFPLVQSAEFKRPEHSRSSQTSHLR